jgi:alkylation response protein AidB-like acyl-CoA dehydrogenase
MVLFAHGARHPPPARGAIVDLEDTPQQAEYRARVRAWIEEHRDQAPPPLRGMGGGGDPAVYRRWQRRLAGAGLAGVMWPTAYGGAGLGPSEAVIANAELERAGVPGIIDHIAIGDIGPAIIVHGTEEQRQRYLGPLLRGDEGWCQLFSEPAAGSDLAGILTRARPSGDGWRIDGQKVWTTLAQYADLGMLLARTDPSVPKHAGLTMFLVPMHAPGVAVHPLRQISGEAHFNEVFFDGVEVTAGAVLGAVGDGWAVATTTLMYERLMAMVAFDQLLAGPEQLLSPILDHPAIDDPRIRQGIAEVTTRRLAMRFAMYRALTALERGSIPGPEAGLGKIDAVEASRCACALIAEVLGPDALEGSLGSAAAEMPGMRSAGGTEEILRNTVGERVLGLPAEPRLDKGVPFSELAGGRR